MSSARPIAILAFDHRGEFSRSVLDKEIAELSESELASLREAKSLIFDGYLEAATRGLGPVRSGVLVDEQFGGEAAKRSVGRDYLLAMPVEQADQDVFDLDYGTAFGEHIEEFDPDYAKALVRFNPDSDESDRRTQLDRLSALSTWLRARDRKFVFELIVRPTAEQLAAVGDDRVRFEDELRPDLVVRAMTQIIDAGIFVDLWKLEGVSDLDDARRIVETARVGNPTAECVILGAAASPERVDQWLSVAAATEGFAGFAIGRNIWKDCIRRWLASDLSREQAVSIVADGYIEFIGRYLEYDQ